MRWRPILPLTLPQRLVVLFAGLIGGTVVITLLFAGMAASERLTELRRQVTHLPELTAAARQDYSPKRRASFDTQITKIVGGLPLQGFRVVSEDGHRLVYERGPVASHLPWWLRAWVDETQMTINVKTTLGTDTPASFQAHLWPQPIRDSVARILTFGSVLAALMGLVFAAVVARIHKHITTPLRQLSGWCRDQVAGPSIAPPNLAGRCREIRELADALTRTTGALVHHRLGHDETLELLAHREQQLQRLTSSVREVALETDPEGKLTYLSPSWERLSGFSLSASLGQPVADFLADTDTASRFSVARLIDLPDIEHETQLRHRDDNERWVRIETRRRYDEHGRFTGIAGNVLDVTAHRRLTQALLRHRNELEALTMVDPLTGLPNRRHFDIRLGEILAEAQADGEPVSLLLIDLDGFKFINDIYGHPIGDEALRTTGRLLKQQVREKDFIARLAGDEFAMILPGTALPEALAIARELHAIIAATRLPLPLGDMSLRSSIGLAETPTHGERPDEIMRAADVALYHSKRQGRNRVEALSPDASRATMSVFTQGFTLRQALEHGNLRPAFQPIYDIQSGREVAQEVLARMRLKDTVVQAKDFITIAEELGLTRELDLHIIAQALRLAPAGQALFLNVDLSSFSDRTFVEELIALLEPARRAGRPITIEITEREAVAITETLLADVQRLRNLGCKLALDDFGSGYSTYYFLDQFRPDYLKIEGSFVRAMLDSEAAHKIVTHIHELARSFGMETIAENVENESIRDALAAIGIRNVQGWLFGEPRIMAQ